MIRNTNGRILQFAGAVILSITGAEASTGVPHPDTVWSHTADTEGIASYAVSIGNRGSQVFSDAGLAHHRTRLFSTHETVNVQPAWETDIDMAVYYQKVTSAETTDLHFSLVRHKNAQDPTRRDLVLRAWRSGSELPLWTRNLLTTTTNYSDLWVACTPDGSRVVSVTRGNPTEQAWIHDGETGALLNNFTMSLFSYPTGAQFSQDCSVMLIHNSLAHQVVRLTDGAVLHESIGTDTNYGAIAISNNGSHFAVSAAGRFEVYERLSTGLYALNSQSFGLPGEQAVDGALSNDGSRAAVAWSLPGASHARVYAWRTDLSTDTNPLNHTFSSPGTERTYPTGLAMSGDGRRLAVAMSGDGSYGVAPEVAVFDATGPDGSYVLRSEYHVAGSVMALDLSGDGTRLATCGRTSHHTNPQVNKVYALYDFDRDLTMEGTPRASNTLTAHIRGSYGTNAYLVVATQAATAPLELPIGTLFLKRTSLHAVIPAGAIGTDGSASTQFTLPANSQHQTYYFQAYTSSSNGRLLGRDWEAVTVL